MDIQSQLQKQLLRITSYAVSISQARIRCVDVTYGAINNQLHVFCWPAEGKAGDLWDFVYHIPLDKPEATERLADLEYRLQKLLLNSQESTQKQAANA